MELVQGLMREWYLVLSQLSGTLSVPVKQVADWAQLPLLSALLLGLLGAMSPCQLTTNISALAYVSRRLSDRLAWREALSYTLGKVLVYMLIGGTIIFLGFQLDKAAIPVVLAARKAIGPLMIIIGLGLLGMIRLSGSLGSRLASSLESHLPQNGLTAAFLLGVLFSFIFCPTHFWLFFGLMIPLAFVSFGGWAFPGIFAIGTAIPLLLFGGILATGPTLSDTLTTRLDRTHRTMSRIAGVTFVLTGFNDTFIYWFM